MADILAEIFGGGSGKAAWQTVIRCPKCGRKNGLRGNADNPITAAIIIFCSECDAAIEVSVKRVIERR